MRIAFDVKGTIDGPHKAQVLRLFHALRALGHECFVWSSDYGYAQDAVATNGLNCHYQSKVACFDEDDKSKFVDIAIDDDHRSTYLAAKRLILVSQLPDDIETFARQLSESK